MVRLKRDATVVPTCMKIIRVVLHLTKNMAPFALKYISFIKGVCELLPFLLYWPTVHYCLLDAQKV